MTIKMAMLLVRAECNWIRIKRPSLDKLFSKDPSQQTTNTTVEPLKTKQKTLVESSTDTESVDCKM